VSASFISFCYNKPKIKDFLEVSVNWPLSQPLNQTCNLALVSLILAKLASKVNENYDYMARNKDILSGKNIGLLQKREKICF